MTEGHIRFQDGAAYERMMGTWSRLAGSVFLAWLAPRSGQRWVDVGCGSGAFTELLAERCAPAEVQGIDPAEAQLAFARTRGAARVAEFRLGDAMALPFGDGRFDAAVMALVIFFVPDPGKGVAEMARVVRPGGTVAAYAWDMLGGGFPNEPIHAEMRSMGLTHLSPPRLEASRTDALQGLWKEAGLAEIATTEIAVQRTFSDFQDFWATSLLGSSVGPVVAALSRGDVDLLKTRVRGRLQADAAGRIICGARANAIKGRVPT
jgi:ubiquinone/menaquinone biosynthesis C-methylase UbiE